MSTVNMKSFYIQQCKGGLFRCFDCQNIIHVLMYTVPQFSLHIFAITGLLSNKTVPG